MGNPIIDFKDPAALRKLTQCLLKRDFNLDVSLPEDRLCPTLANRLDYLYHLLDIRNHLEREADTKCTPLKVLDIGTGACAIYAILLARIAEGPQIWATELNAASLESASTTLRENDLVRQVNLVTVSSEETPLLDVISSVDLDSGDTPFTFSLCNPPFYGSAEEMQASTDLKALPTHAAPTAADNELITAGGEVAFIGRMIDESVDTREQCLWYTSLIGKASSIPLLIEKLRKHEIDNYLLLGMRQAHTTRWVIGWSFTDIRLPDAITRTAFPSIAKYMPPPNTWTYRPLERVRKPLPFDVVVEYVTNALRAAGLDSDLQPNVRRPHEEERPRGRTWSIAPRTITWTRAARRNTSAAGDVPSIPLFCANVRVEAVSRERARSPGEEDVVISLDWTRGKDRKVVDGLWAFLVRKVGDAMRS